MPNIIPIGFYQGAGAPPGLLDVLGVPAAAAYSLRLLRTGYSGKCINVMSGSNNMDIGFTASGVLDTVSLVNFVAANGGTGTVATWYDQSGNGVNCTNATQSTQPIIAASSTVTVQNSVPSLHHTGSQHLAISPAQGFALGDTVVVGTYTSPSTAGQAFWGGFVMPAPLGAASQDLGNINASLLTLNVTFSGYGVDVTVINNVTTNTIPTGLFQVNSQETSVKAVASWYSAASGIWVGGASSSFGFLTGYLSEVIFFSTILSAPNRTNAYNNQKAFYGTP